MEYYGRYIEDEQAPSPFAKFLQEYEIVTQYIMSRSSYQNDVVKKRNVILLDMIRAVK